jgi:4-hydroxy-tetrahydrodipicolinate reductase
MMKIAILGYGKMGKAIEEIAIERGHVVILRTSSTEAIDTKLLKSATVAIEFSRPDTVVENINTCFDLRVPVVVGTTGWQEDMIHIKNRCLDEGQSIFYASNFSIGVNIFNEVSKNLARLISQYPEYKTSIEETHHIHKVDKPSGTAILLAEGILDNHEHLQSWKLDAVDKNVLSITSHREGDVPGTHVIKHESEIDSITFTHEAKSRKGFALGAVLAAEFLPGKIGNYSMKDLLKLDL